MLRNIKGTFLGNNFFLRLQKLEKTEKHFMGCKLKTWNVSVVSVTIDAIPPWRGPLSDKFQYARVQRKILASFLLKGTSL